MKNKIIMGLIGLSMALSTGCSESKTTEINVLATTDLHGIIPYELSSYVKEERKKDGNITLVDAGDFFEGDNAGEMGKYFDQRYKDIQNNDEKYIEVPFTRDMKELGYDSVVLGNHEFISNNRFYLDNMISDFEKQGIDVLSANTYEEKGENYIKPYTMKEIETPEGTVRLGILGLTIKEVGEKNNLDEDGNLVLAKSRELKDQYGYDGNLYMNDLVEDAKKWVKVMKEDKADIIVAVAHSGEKPKKPKNPGNRIQELAQEVEGIDAIVAGHTHKEISQHDYKNKLGETVIVTQPKDYGQSISKINFKMEKNKDKWEVVEKSSGLTKFEKSPEDDNLGKIYSKIISIDKNTKEVSLSDIVPFEWDKAYSFAPHTSVDVVYDKVGYKWRSIREAESEDIIQMVFMKDERPVCYLYGDVNQMGISIKFDKSEYKYNVVEISPKVNDKFKVEKGKKEYERHLNHIVK